MGTSAMAYRTHPPDRRRCRRSEDERDGIGYGGTRAVGIARAGAARGCSRRIEREAAGVQPHRKAASERQRQRDEAPGRKRVREIHPSLLRGGEGVEVDLHVLDRLLRLAFVPAQLLA